MFCKECGAKMEGNPKYCPNCGANVLYDEQAAENSEAAVQEEPVWESETTYEAHGSEPAAPDASPLMVWGILGIAFACTPYINFLGIIFSCIAKKKIRSYVADGGVIAGKAKVGNILSKIGFVVGIILTVYYPVMLIAQLIGA